MSADPLRVAVDARCLNTGHLHGTSKMMHELVRRTASSGAVHWTLLSTRHDRFHMWEQWSLPSSARRLGVDLLHAPAGTMPWWQPVPTVVTLHDTIAWQQDTDALPAGFYRDRLLPAAYERAAAIITTSNNARRNILARWPILKQKLHVIPRGVDERYLEAEADQQPMVIADQVVREPYVLYVGGAAPLQRLAWALQAWAGSSEQRPTTMVVCGVETFARDAVSQIVRQMVPHSLHDRLILAPFIPDDDMPRLYMRASAVLYPGLRDGLGLPVIEAHAVGTPVLFSDVDELSELKGPAAIVLPVDDLQAWIRALDLAVQSQAHRAGPDRVARAWAAQYSWDACVDRTLAVYHDVAERHAVSHDLHPATHS